MLHSLRNWGFDCSLFFGLDGAGKVSVYFVMQASALDASK